MPVLVRKPEGAEDGGSIFLRNVCVYVRVYTASQPVNNIVILTAMKFYSVGESNVAEQRKVALNEVPRGSTDAGHGGRVCLHST
jgi:hypothetical protein